MSLGNPYVIERPLLEGDLFIGRYNLLVEIMQNVKRGRQMLVVYGPTRIGRTSFLYQLSRELASYCPALCVNLAWPKEGGVAEAMAQLQSAVREGLNAWPGQPAYPVCAAGDEVVPVVPPRGGTEYLETVPPALPQRPLVVLVDGLSGPDLSGDKGAAWVGVCEAWLASMPSLTLVMAIESTRPKGSALFSPALTSLDGVELKGLTFEETEELLLKPARGRMAYEFDAVRRIWQLTDGHPYLVQLCGHALFEAFAGGRRVGLHDVERVIADVLAAAQPVMERIWQSCSAQAQVVLSLANDLRGRHGIVAVQELQTLSPRFGLPLSAAATEAVVDELRTRGVLHQLSSGGYRFSPELFRLWLDASGKTLPGVLKGTGYKRASGGTSRGERRLSWSNVVTWVLALAAIVVVVVLWNRRGAAARQVLGSSPTAAPTPAATRPPLVVGAALGNIAYMARDNADTTWDIWIMRGDGSDPRRLTDDPGNDISPTWSPDGRSIAFVSDRDGNREIYVMKADGTQQINLTHEPAEDWTPAWSPDGAAIAFASYRDANWEIYTMNADGTSPQRLTRSNGADYAPCWSPDSQFIAFQSNRDGNWEIYVVTRDGKELRRLTNNEATDSAPSWSPDGELIAFESYRDGNMEIYIMMADGSEAHNISRDPYSNDHGPVWARGGDRILYHSNRDAGWDIFSMKPDGTDKSNLTLSPALEQYPTWHE